MTIFFLSTVSHALYVLCVPCLTVSAPPSQSREETFVLKDNTKNKSKNNFLEGLRYRQNHPLTLFLGRYFPTLFISILPSTPRLSSRNRQSSVVPVLFTTQNEKLLNKINPTENKRINEKGDYDLSTRTTTTTPPRVCPVPGWGRSNPSVDVPDDPR